MSRGVKRLERPWLSSISTKTKKNVRNLTMTPVSNDVSWGVVMTFLIEKAFLHSGKFKGVVRILSNPTVCSWERNLPSYSFIDRVKSKDRDIAKSSKLVTSQRRLSGTMVRERLRMYKGIKNSTPVTVNILIPHAP